MHKDVYDTVNSENTDVLCPSPATKKKYPLIMQVKMAREGTFRDDFFVLDVKDEVAVGFFLFDVFILNLHLLGHLHAARHLQNCVEGRGRRGEERAGEGEGRRKADA